MKITELNVPSSMDGAVKVLTDAGYEELGSGAYGSVWMKPGANYVLKIFDGDDTAYYDFVEMCKRYPNPHFPKFFGKLIKVTPEYKAVRTELLKPSSISIQDSDLIEHLVIQLSDYQSVEAIREKMGEKFDTYYKPIMNLIDDDTFVEACILVTNLIDSSHYYSDIHPKNFMERNGVLVFTDPVV